MAKHSISPFQFVSLVAIGVFLVFIFVSSVSSSSKNVSPKDITDIINNNIVDQSVFAEVNKRNLKSIKQPKRYNYEEKLYEPPSLKEIEHNVTYYLKTLHARLGALAGPTVDAQAVWETYLDVTKNTVMLWDDQNRNRFHKPRKDNTIYVALGTYRDPFCPMTIKSLFKQAEHPERLYIGLFQQNCFEKKCRTGVLVGGVIEDTSTDPNCYDLFCASEEGIASNACNTDQIRLFNVNESESLGPYMARYLGAKFYGGEQYYLQIDSHSEFSVHWDTKLVKMVTDAPAKKPVISTYPPGQEGHWQDSIGYRICDSEFAAAQIEWQIIRLGSSLSFDKSIPAVPKYAPFVAAGFFFTYADFLHEVPFDPLLPWIFMGEEISMSSRLWTAGYDIFSPTMNVLNHYYVRRHYPKFWETVNRYFKKPIHNDLVEMVIKRCKNMLGYPECHADLVNPVSVLYRVDDWGMGNKRSYDSYLKMVGIEPISKKITRNQWCHDGNWPQEALPYYYDKKTNEYKTSD